MHMIRRTLTRRLSGEEGQSLVIALLVMTFLAISLGVVMFFSAGNQRNANYQKAAQVASSLAEAGVNNAVSVLANPSNSGCLLIGSGCTAPLPSTSGVQTTTYNGSTVTWWGTLNTLGDGSKVWTVYGQSSVQNPTGPSGAAVVKRVSAQVRVNTPPSNSFQVGVWNTVYSPLGPTAGCDTSLGQGVNVTVPLYVGGNLCMANQSSVNAPVYVGGFLNISIKQATRQLRARGELLRRPLRHAVQPLQARACLRRDEGHEHLCEQPGHLESDRSRCRFRERHAAEDLLGRKPGGARVR